MAGSNKAKAKQVIKDLCDYLSKKRPSEQRISDAIKDLNFKDGVDVNKKTIQAIFAKVERFNHGTSELLVGNFSLEHVEDQSSGLDWVGSLGNLLPLDEDLNNRIKPGSTFKAKKKQYEKSSLRVVAEFLKLNPGDEWSKAAADEWLDYLSKAVVAATSVKPLS